MECPFRHLSGPGEGTSDPADIAAALPAPSPGPSACPFSGRLPQQPAGSAATGAGGGAGVAAAGAGAACGGQPRCEAGSPASAAGQGANLQPSSPSASAAEAAGQCPFLSGLGSVAVSAPAPASGDAAAEGAAPAQAVCPLGFGGQSGPKLGQFHCMLCKSLFHECTLTSCGHRYCAGCIVNARDCPACGADIVSLRADDQTQALVERYIDAHAGSHTIWELEGPAGRAQQVEGMAGERSRASFLLQLGLRALAAGNIAAARHHLTACQGELELQLATVQLPAPQDEEPPAVAAIRCRLGAVSGCLGDCCRAEGDAVGTLQHYEQSVRLLQAAGDDPEAQQALSVALNKVGELRHMQGQLGAAAALYAEALQLRRALLAAAQQQAQGVVGRQADVHEQGGAAAQPAVDSEACCSAGLDLAASCIKLAGAQRELGSHAEAQELLAEAAAVLGGLEMVGQPSRLQRKHASLADYAATMARQR